MEQVTKDLSAITSVYFLDDKVLLFAGSKFLPRFNIGFKKSLRNELIGNSFFLYVFLCFVINDLFAIAISEYHFFCNRFVSSNKRGVV